MGMTYHHYYDEVAKFRDTIGLYQDDPGLHDALFQEEAAELEDALELGAAAKTRDERQAAKAATADALADMLVIWCGKDVDVGVPMDDTHRFFEDMKQRAQSAGIYLAGAFRKVMDSNYTKLCPEDELQDSIDKYTSIGVAVEPRVIEPGLFALYAANDTEHAPHGKLLKPVGYREPQWGEKGWES